MKSTSYDNMVGSLMYVMTCTRPNIVHANRLLRKYMANLGKPHWEVVKWVLRYLKGTPDYEIMFDGNLPSESFLHCLDLTNIKTNWILRICFIYFIVDSFLLEPESRWR